MKPLGMLAGIAFLLATPLAVAATPAADFDARLTPDQQALHVLNRLAFGPRPGDVEAVKRMGVKAWIRQQLDPATVPENPQLEARLKQLPALDLPTWQLIDNFTPPQMMINLTPLNLMQSVPVDKLARLTSGATPVEERRSLLAGLSEDSRNQVLAVLPPQLVDGIPEYRQQAMMARQQRQDMVQRQVDEQNRKLRPPLNELFTPDQLDILRHGSDAQKTALMDGMEPARRAQAFRSMGEQGVKLLPVAYRGQAMLAANPQQGVVSQMIEAKLDRAVLSNRQLQEVLVDFWFNHFNVSITKAPVRMLLPSYEREAIRPHVLGHFRDMLLATARDPAMLYYLDNYLSQAPRSDMLASLPNIRVPGINENYGRELMELHTLGIDGGYTQQDVVNVARAFTGWTIFDVSRVGEFQFDPAKHDRNEKHILGQDFPRGVEQDEGVRVIDMLARSPATAHHISLELAQRFVADAPPAALVQRMADTFIRTDGDLRAVMETMLLSNEFLSTGAWRSKVKSPLEMVASALRALDADISDTGALAQRLTDLGQPLYAKAEPTGYPNTSEAWANSVGLLGRMNFAAALARGQIAGVQVRPDALPDTDFRKAMRALTGVEPSAAEVAAVAQGATAGTPGPALLATALIGSPEFQKR